jgi:ABC-2 type transport system permease protein
MNFLAIKTFSKIAIRRAFRDKTAIFFIFAFPLIFLFIFGGIFGKNDDLSFKVGFVNESQSSVAKQLTAETKKSKIFKIDDKITTLDSGKDKLHRGQLDAIIVLPADFGTAKAAGTPSGTAQVYYTQNSEQAGSTLTTLLDNQFQAVNAQFVNTKMPFKAEGKEISTPGLSRFDYTFAGLLGFSIIGLGIFGPVNVFPELKKQGVLRRLRTTPLRVSEYFLSNVISQSVIGIVSVALQFIVAITFFHLRISGGFLSFVELVLFIVLSIITILGIGLAIGGWARNEQQSAPLSNIVVFPMLFLSGTFFPRFLMPEWLQKLSTFLPLTPVIDGIRLIATEGKSLFELGPQLGILAGWIVIVYIIAFNVFRWE